MSQDLGQRCDVQSAVTDSGVIPYSPLLAQTWVLLGRCHATASLKEHFLLGLHPAHRSMYLSGNLTRPLSNPLVLFVSHALVATCDMLLEK